MNSAETVRLISFVVAACPNQKVDDMTTEAWRLLLDDVRYDDALAAAVALAKRQPFIAPPEIRAEVRRLRDGRITAAVIPDPPPEVADSPQAYREWRREILRRIADGDPVEVAPVVPALPRDVAGMMKTALTGKEIR